MTDHRNDRVGEWYKARLFSVRSAVLANKKRIHELNAAIRTESEALAELKVEMKFEAQEQRGLRAPFWRDGSRLAFQARKAAETGSLAVVHVGSGLPPRRAFSGVQREAPFPRPRPVVMPENNLPLHALAREEPHRHREFAPWQLAVARIDELYSRPPPVEYEQDPQEISAIIHRDPRMHIMPSWQPVQVVPEDLDVEMTDAPALLEFNMSGALGDACSAAHGSMELFQPAQVVGLVSTYTLSLLFTVDNLLTPHLQQHTNFPVPTPTPVFNTAPVQPSPLRLPPVVAPTSNSTATWASASVSVATAGGAAAGTTTNKPTTSTPTSGGPPGLAKLAQAAVPASAAAPAPVNKPAPVPPQPAQASTAPAAPKTIGAAGRRPPQLLVISYWTSAPVGSTSSSFDTPEVQPLPEPAADDHVDGPAKKKSMASGSAAASGGPSGPVNFNRPKPSASRAAASAASRRRAPVMTGSNVVRNNTASASDGAAASLAAAAASTPFTFTQATFAPSSQPPGT